MNEFKSQYMITTKSGKVLLTGKMYPEANFFILNELGATFYNRETMKCVTTTSFWGTRITPPDKVIDTFVLFVADVSSIQCVPLFPPEQPAQLEGKEV